MNRHRAIARCLSMIFSENRCPPRIKCGAGFFRIMPQAGSPDPSMSKRLLIILFLISACLLPPARAQDAAAPFDGDLQRLAEILGTLHYLRGICGSNEGNKW